MLSEATHKRNTFFIMSFANHIHLFSGDPFYGSYVGQVKKQMVSSTMTTDFLAHKKDMGNLFVFHSLCTLFQLTLSATAYFRAANPRGGVAESAPHLS